VTAAAPLLMHERRDDMSKELMTEVEQYLSFKLEDEVFALDITKVREVLDLKSITKVPKTPDFMRGIINLRGNVVPVVDLRLKFGMSKTEKTVTTCIIIVETKLDEDKIMIGALADSVQEVFDLNADQIEPPPTLGTKLNVDFIKGMGKLDDRLVIILNIDKVFSEEEVASIVHTGNVSQEIS
jgi:purine-binding chemotaxis protein CheW